MKNPDLYYGETLEEEIEKLNEINAELLEACEFVVNDIPEAGEDAQLTVKGYNMLCNAINKAKQ